MKTIKLSNGKRPDVELPYENYQAHQEVVDAWFYEGVEVEFNNPCDSLGFEAHVVGAPSFASEIEYRIAQRKPQAGEVWIAPGNTPWLRVGDETDFNGWVTLEGNDADSDTGIGALTYAAPSVKAYYAR